MDEHGGEKREASLKQSLNYREQTEGCWRRGAEGRVRWVMGIRKALTVMSNGCCM